MKKTILQKARDKQIDNRLAIVHDVLLPKSTLQSVGDNWGISRERVSQIFQAVTKKHYSAVRADLLRNSDKYFCIMCGAPVDPRSGKIYCSRECRGIVKKYDLKNPKVCKYCGKTFFPLRNWRSMSKLKKCMAGQYCCFKHYILYGSRTGERFSRNSNLIEKLKQLGGNHGS